MPNVNPIREKMCRWFFPYRVVIVNRAINNSAHGLAFANLLALPTSRKTSFTIGLSGTKKLYRGKVLFSSDGFFRVRKNP